MSRNFKFKETAREIRSGMRHAPWYVKVLVTVGLLYLMSPVDLIPDFIPVLGQLDDVLLVTGLLRLVRRYALDKTD
jgi:uncharacterized membrane protein YkvA (DUF1232 family)